MSTFGLHTAGAHSVLPSVSAQTSPMQRISSCGVSKTIKQICPLAGIGLTKHIPERVAVVRVQVLAILLVGDYDVALGVQGSLHVNGGPV